MDAGNHPTPSPLPLKERVAVAARRREGEPKVSLDPLGHERYDTQGIDAACAVPHDYHFV